MERSATPALLLLLDLLLLLLLLPKQSFASEIVLMVGGSNEGQEFLGDVEVLELGGDECDADLNDYPVNLRGAVGGLVNSHNVNNDAKCTAREGFI